MVVFTPNHPQLPVDVTILLPLQAVICWNNSLFAVCLHLICNLAVTCVKFGVRFAPNESAKRFIGADVRNGDICIISC